MDITFKKDRKIDHPSEKKPKAFLSYSRDDLDFVYRLQTALVKQGIDDLIDREDIERGEDWWNRITLQVEKYPYPDNYFLDSKVSYQ